MSTKQCFGSGSGSGRIRIIWPDPNPDPHQETLIWIRVPNVMSFKLYTEKIEKKKIGICSILGRIRIQNRTRIRHPGSGSADPVPDPHQNDTDPKHCN